MKNKTFQDEILRVKTLMFETDNLIKNKYIIIEEESTVPNNPSNPASKDVKPINSGTTTPTTTTTTTSQQIITPDDKDLLKKNIKDFTLNLVNGTEVFKNAGYGKNRSDIQYMVNKGNNDVYRVQNGIIKAIFKHNIIRSESYLNSDVYYVNPILFESILNEQQIMGEYYTCIGDCHGQTKMSNKFTETSKSVIKNSNTPKVN